MIVMPGYREANLADALACYTRRHRDLATGSHILGTVHLRPRVVTNLVDGIYDLQTLSTCYHTDIDQYYPWFRLSFATPVTVHRVKLMAQPEGSLVALKKLGNLEAPRSLRRSRLGIPPRDRHRGAHAHGGEVSVHSETASFQLFPSVSPRSVLKDSLEFLEYRDAFTDSEPDGYTFKTIKQEQKSMNK